jgi:hypothetical protein
LVKQFLGEAMMTTLLSLGIALIIVVLLLPAFNSFTGKEIKLPVSGIDFWIGVVGLALITGLISGSYPAFFLSSLDPIKGFERFSKSWSTGYFISERACRFPIFTLYYFDHWNNRGVQAGTIYTNEESWLQQRKCDQHSVGRCVARPVQCL